MKRNGFYRNKYIIGIYSSIQDGEQLLGLCDNVQEFAKLMEIKENNARMILNKLFHKEINTLRFFGKICLVEFIDFINIE